MHNFALHIKAHFVQVDQLISYVKASIVKCKKRAELFHEIGIPPQPIVTRWGTWLEAALYYAKNWTLVKRIVLEYENDGVIVKNAKTIVESDTIFNDLVKISNYENLIKLTTKLECPKLLIKEGVH
ncbi:hypothetical protein A3Q56_08585 [Intoshia linei]|uniref:Uncharacterized protein n=1 Tax=Intoshia linei TaxID=1819745 RepID=A0A177AQM7_9BILA|nr:hypothetical protein A3Q56_08585 [Intoshia linei]